MSTYYTAINEEKDSVQLVQRKRIYLVALTGFAFL